MKATTEENKTLPLCRPIRRKAYASCRGAALLVVLLIVMAVTILSLGFLSRSDVELTCGENMILRAQMDYLAESALEHAEGLILNPQDLSTQYWQGGIGQQLYSGSDYYDVSVTQHGPSSGPTYRCNYDIVGEAYRIRSGDITGRSTLKAELRLDPCIALWTGQDVKLSDSVIINGDVFCSGALTNEGIINGDVFANVLNGSIAGRHQPVVDLSLQWPRVTATDFISHYTIETIGSDNVSNLTLGSCEPVRVCYRNGDLVLAGNTQVEGMLVVDGDLMIRGGGNVITAGKNMPALLVTSDLIMDAGASLDVDGLIVVDGDVQVGGDCNGVNIIGGLFCANTIAQAAMDSSGNNNHAVLHGAPVWQPSAGQVDGALRFDGIDDKLEESDAGTYLNGLSAITLCLWVKSDVTGQDRGILFTRDPTGNDEEFGLRYDDIGAFGGGVNIIKASIRSTWGYTQIESTSDTQTSEWQHLALVWDSGDSLKLYINGNLNLLTHDTGTLGGTVSGVQKLILGQDTKATYWDGLMDDVRIYDRVLEAGEIYPAPTEVGLIAHWKLDEEGPGDINVTAAPSRTAIMVWSETGTAQKWGQAAAAFLRSVERE
ncbi:MAG: LamG domain-containing protein [Planctomycetota bacterium]|jgi:hypothetical protein